MSSDQVRIGEQCLHKSILCASGNPFRIRLLHSPVRIAADIHQHCGVKPVDQEDGGSTEQSLHQCIEIPAGGNLHIAQMCFDKGLEIINAGMIVRNA